MTASSNKNFYFKNQSEGESGCIEEEDELRLKEVKEKILEAAMSFVPQCGWSAEAIAKGSCCISLLSKH